jgi:hypothetical protein
MTYKTSRAVEAGKRIIAERDEYLVARTEKDLEERGLWPRLQALRRAVRMYEANRVRAPYKLR